VNSVEEKRENFCKAIDGKPHFRALYGMYTVKLNELKAIFKVSAQAGQNGVVNKTSVEPTAQDDDFRQVKKRRRQISNDISQTAKKLTKPAPTSITVKLPPKVVVTHNFYAPLRTDRNMKTTGADNTLPEQEAPRKSGRPPPTVMTSTTNLIRLQSDLKEHFKAEYEF
jgi:hypothetical protein